MVVAIPARRSPSLLPFAGEAAAVQVIPTRLALLRAGASAPATVGVHREGALGKAASSGSMVLAWHTNIASGGLDPQLHEVTSAEDVIIFAVGFPAT